MELATFFSIDVIPLFNGYPLSMSMAKATDNGVYFWATAMCHQRLLNYDEKLEPRKQDMEKAGVIHNS
jgi:hypothetical protein